MLSFFFNTQENYTVVSIYHYRITFKKLLGSSSCLSRLDTCLASTSQPSASSSISILSWNLLIHVKGKTHLSRPCALILAAKGDSPASCRDASAAWKRRSISASITSL